MTPTTAIESTVAVHGHQITDVKERQDRLDEAVVRLDSKLDGLRNWIMGAVLASCLGLVGVIAQLVRR